MSCSFDFEIFLSLGFGVRSYKDSWDREIIEYTYTRNDTTFTLLKRQDSEFVMGIRATNSGEWENHMVDQEEALLWFQRLFPTEAPL
jgi:hypothetical protein